MNSLAKAQTRTGKPSARSIAANACAASSSLSTIDTCA
jgi:hypothetical protein